MQTLIYIRIIIMSTNKQDQGLNHFTVCKCYLYVLITLISTEDNMNGKVHGNPFLLSVAFVATSVQLVADIWLLT